jgi:Uncharacterized conserved protein
VVALALRCRGACEGRGCAGGGGIRAATGRDVRVDGRPRSRGTFGPRGGKADDLKRIRGIGKQNEGRLHGLGIWHFDQIAAWTPAEVRWVGAFLAFPGRIEREGWVEQAAVLAKGGETDFSKRADKGLVATSRDDADDDGQGNVISIDKAKIDKDKPKSGNKPKPTKK